MNITVVGAGYVGLTTAVCLAHIGHNVCCIDVDDEKIKQLNMGKAPIFENNLEELINENISRLCFTNNHKKVYQESSIVFVCVGTPDNEDGSVNLNYVYNVCNQVKKEVKNDCLIIIKSTVSVGTCDKIEKILNSNSDYVFKVVSNPEFLSQGTAINDTLFASRIIVGSTDKSSDMLMRQIYLPLTKSPYNVPYVSISRRSAEMIKYAANNFLALKISYINEIANLCEKTGANVDEIVAGIGLDDRIGSKFLNAGIGYGGSCLPKDAKALYRIGLDNNIQLQTVKACIDVNEKQTTILFKKLLNILGNIKNKKVCVLGLTFKPNTDDLRNSPALNNIFKLLEWQADVRVYDPIALDKFKDEYDSLFKRNYSNSNISYFKHINEAITGADAVVIMTEWPEIVNYDVNQYRKLMNYPLVFDGRNCYNLKKMEDNFIEYYSIGRVNNTHIIPFSDFCVAKKEFFNIFRNEINHKCLKHKDSIRKYKHTLEVIDFAQEIAIKREINYNEMLLLYVICLFHDIGRFTEVEKYSCISDYNRIDHATMSVKKISENSKLMSLLEKYNIDLDKVKNCIYYHNKLIIPDEYQSVEFKILMDADKLSILHLFSNGEIINLHFCEDATISCLESFNQKKLINVGEIKNNTDILLKYLAFAFNFNYKESLLILSNSNYIENLVNNATMTDKIQLNCYRVIDYLKQNKC